MSAMGPKEGKTVGDLINQIKRFDSLYSRESSQHKTQMQELLKYLSDLDEVELPEKKKLDFAREVMDDYYQYQGLIGVLMSASKEIYKRPPPPNHLPLTPTELLPKKPPVERIPIHFLKPGSVRKLFNDYFAPLEKHLNKIEEIKENICEPTHGVASQWSAYPTAKYSAELTNAINTLDKEFQKLVGRMPQKMQDSPVYEKELKAQKAIFQHACDCYLQVRQKITLEFKENSEPKRYLDAGKDKVKELDKIFAIYISKSERIKLYAQYGFSVSDDKSRGHNRKKGNPG